MNNRERQWASDMQAAQRGCREAYARLLADISATFRQFAAADLRRYGLQASDHEDVLQEILLAVHLKRDTWRPGYPFLPWLRAITRHKVIDFVRRRSRRSELPIDDFPDVFPAPQPEADITGPLHQALVELPRRQREVIEELAVGGASVADTAMKLRMSRGAVYVAFHRALATISAKMSL
jgi:RNA polymerase sigma-70 factor, ECF subfamily